MIKISPTSYPKKEVVCFCDECAKEIAREAFHTYFDYDRVKLKLKRQYKTCPFCEDVDPSPVGAGIEIHSTRGRSVGMTGAKKVKWEKHVDIYGRVTRNWEAKLPDGDFLVWRQGKVWRARWRVYGSDMPIMLGFSSTLTGIKQRCEHSRYWPKAE